MYRTKVCADNYLSDDHCEVAMYIKQWLWWGMRVVYAVKWVFCNKFITGVCMTLTNLHSNCTSIASSGLCIISLLVCVLGCNNVTACILHSHTTYMMVYRSFAPWKRTFLYLMISLQAAKRNLTYPRYVWITFGWYPYGWWIPENDVSCSNQQLEDFIVKARMLQVQQYPTPNNIDGSTISGIVRLAI